MIDTNITIKKKIVYFSIACGIILFILIFICQIFLKIYSNAMDLNKIYTYDAIFLTVYMISVYFFMRYGNMNKFILYIVTPCLLGCVIYVFSAIYYYIAYGSRIIIDVFNFASIYIATGFWAVGILSGLIDVILSYIILENRSRSPSPM